LIDNVGVARQHGLLLGAVAHLVILIAAGADGLACLLALFRREAAQFVIDGGLHPASPIAQAFGSHLPIAQIIQGVVHSETGAAVFGVGYSGQAADPVVTVLSCHAVGVSHLV